MKEIILIILLLVSAKIYSQEPNEKEIETSVDNVTVFAEGAQVTREKSVDIGKGETLLNFTGLSPFIDAKSLQAKVKGKLTVLSVNHQEDYIDKLEKSDKLKNLELELEEVNRKIELENTHLDILEKEISFLNANKDIGGKNQEVNINNLKEAADFYSNRLKSLKLKEIERTNTLSELSERKADIKRQAQSMMGSKETAVGEILIKVKAENACKANFTISYMVDNAGWYPSYDIKAKNINEPLEIVYKANVHQDTKVNWDNVNIKLSTSEPKTSGVAPKLKTYYLDYNSLPPVYDHDIGTVYGRVLDKESNDPIPGVNVIVKGTTIGTTTDMDGNYSIKIPNYANYLTYLFVGMKKKTLPINNSIMDVTLEPSVQELEEVVVGYGSEKKNFISRALSGKVAGVDIDNTSDREKKDRESIPIQTRQERQQTTVSFEIEMPYTIKSDGKNYVVDMDTYNVPSTYQHYCVPMIDNDAFLIANIKDWEKYNFLDGEANIYFEDTYIGKTILDLNNASDTLKISLGRDKSVSVNRAKIQELTSKQFIGSKKEETRAWNTTVKNNKAQKINMVLLDQVPVSTVDDIEVDVENKSGAQLNNDKGEIKWKFTLEPGSSKEFELRYSVKYSKQRDLILE